MFKIKLIILVQAFTFLNTLNAQEYRSTFGESNEWNIIKSFEGTYTETITLGENRLIDGKTYKDLISGISNVAAYVREDTGNRIIYIHPLERLNINNEFIMYDFSLEKDDSITLYNIESWQVDTLGIYIVESTSTFNTLAGERKVIYLQSLSHIYVKPVWIEGIGTIGNFLYPGSLPNEWNEGALSCFFKDGVQIYQSPDYDSCDIFTNIDYKKIENSAIDIFPNPVENILHIRFKNDQPLVKIYLSNIIGDRLMSRDFINTNVIELDLSNYNTGVYFLEIFGNKDVFGHKIIKY